MDIREDARCWLVRAGRGGGHIDSFVGRGFASLGFHLLEVGDLRGLDADELLTRVRAGGASVPGADARELREFRDMRVGDIIVTVDPDRGEVVVGVVAGEYEHADSPIVGDHRHHRRVEWLGRWDREALPAAIAATTRTYKRTVKELPAHPGLLALAQRSAAGDGDPPMAPTRPTRTPQRRGVREGDVLRAPSDRRCPSCQMTRAASLFDGELCRDCA